jgi:hypothetical protein
MLFFSDLFQQIETITIESGYSVKGQNAYHPKLIVSILNFGLQPWCFQFPANRKALS